MQKPEEVLNIGDKVMAKVISISAADRKIGLSVREAQRDHRQVADGRARRKPRRGGRFRRDAGFRAESMMQAGRSLADVAHEMMAAVSRAEAARTAEAAPKPKRGGGGESEAAPETEKAE